MGTLREDLEAAANSIEQDTSEEIQASPVQQSPEESAPSKDVTEPVAGDPSQEGSVTTSDSDKPKSISETLSEQVKDEEDKTPLETKPVEKQPKEVSDKSDQEEKSQTVKEVEKPPASWKGEAKQLWADLPKTARDEIIRRERQTTQVLNDTALDRKRVQEITQVLQPHMDRIGALYQGNPLAAINGLLNVERELVSGTKATKAQVVANIIKQFDIDIMTLDSLLAGNDLPPEVRQQNEVERLLQERMQPMMEYVNQQKQREVEANKAKEQQFLMTVEEMANDARYPHFYQVSNDMADLIELVAKRGIDLSLQDAYDKAIKMNGLESQQESQPPDTEAATRAALDAHQAAQKAKGASVSVSGNPASTTSSTIPANTDLRSLISSAIEGGGNRL